MKTFKQFLEAKEISYLYIGHDPANLSTNVLWVWDEQKDFLKTATSNEPIKHHKIWGDNFSSKYWAGRFDKKKNMVSVAPPGKPIRKEIPEKLKQRLKAQFGSTIVFKGFGVKHV